MLRPPVQDVSVIVLPDALLRGHSTCNQLANLHQPAGFQGNPLVKTHWPKLFLPELRDKLCGKLIVTPEDNSDRTVGAVSTVKTSPRGPLHSAQIAGRGKCIVR